MKKKILSFALVIGIMSSMFFTLPMTANATNNFEQYYFLGDANGDSKINIKDVISMRSFLTGGCGEIIVNTAADVNKDGNIDVEDVVALRQYIAGGYDIDLMETYEGGKFEVVVPDSWNNPDEGEKVNSAVTISPGEVEIILPGKDGSELFPSDDVFDDYIFDFDTNNPETADPGKISPDEFDYIIWQ